MTDSESPVQTSLRLLLRLHALMAAGHCDTAEADAVRDSMETPWHAMTEAEQELVGWLSGHLYTVDHVPGGDTLFVPGDVVCLRSGGPPMTVTYVSDDGTRVGATWFYRRAVLVREFNALTLRHYQPEKEEDDAAQARQEQPDGEPEHLDAAPRGQEPVPGQGHCHECGRPREGQAQGQGQKAVREPEAVELLGPALYNGKEVANGFQ